MRISAIVIRKALVARSLVAEALRVLREDGTGAAAVFAAAIVRWTFGRKRRAPKVNPVDREFGTDTSADARLHGLRISSRNVRYAVYYRATSYPILREVLAALTIPHQEYSFVDCGSGKGLVVLEAAAYPFRKVIGVEFARELHEIAVQNLARVPSTSLRTGVEFICEDVLTYELPDGNLVLYLYEPFEPPLVRKMIARIETLRSNREVIVAHVRSTNRRINSRGYWDAAPFLEKMAEGVGWTIYRSTEPAARPLTY